MRDAMILIMVVWLGACCSFGACLAGPQPRHILATRAGLLHLPQLSVSTHGLPDSSAKQRRALLAAQHSAASSTSTLHLQHMHPAWALLATHSNYLFSFEGMSYAAQQQTLAAIHAHGAVVTSVMPPHTWVVTASLQTAEWLAQLPSTALVPYPKFLKLAPEWVSVTTNMHMDGLAAQLQAAMQHDSLSACGEEPALDAAAHTAWAACRIEAGRMGASFSNGTAQPRVPGTVSKPSNSQQALHPKFLIEVQFPVLTREDMARLGLTPVASWQDGLQHMSHTMSAAGAAAGTKAGDRARYANGTFLPAVAAAVDWQGPIQAAAPACGADLIMEHGTLLVAACAQDLMSVLSWLAQQPSVRWLAPRMQLQLHNLAASTISQSGGMTDITDLKNDELRAFWQAGIDGTGQILGIGDSGLDMDNCYFFDQANIVSRSSFTDSNGNLVYDNPGHRKVILYYSLYDNVIDPGGHGTHTSGTLAGAAWGEDPLHSPSRATGMAPGAKLAFLSLSSPSDAPGSTLVHTPGDLRDSYYPRSYIKGARIHSDSWGNTNTNYDSMCSSADMFAYENQDFLPIFSAGNYGDDVSGASYKATITSPALAKNVMGIGATHSFDSQAPPAGGEPTLMMTITISTAAKPLIFTALMVKARAGGSWDQLKGSPLPLAAASSANGDNDACSTLSNAASVAGRIVIAVRSTKCNYDTQLNTISAAGGRGLILTNNALDGYFYLPDPGVDLSGLPPAGGVPMGVGRMLWDAANSPLGASITFSDRATTEARYDQLATFSSFGPTLDGRIKPDLVATGFLWSANSDNLLTGATTCVPDFLQRQGTSMAAPAVAGSAALVRQYFADGFYPSGAKSSDNKPWQPSGPLVRAVLMAGAASMLGNVERGNPTAGGLPMERPSMRQGWGRMDLSGSLPLTSSNANKGWSIQVVDQATLVQDGRHRYCVNALDGPLRIMLVWHDYPGDVMASKTLVNNLDLEVKADGLGSKLLMGNVYGANYLNPENQQQTGDDVNNVESVFLENVPSGLVVINVVGRSISAKTTNQTYALVVLGRFSGTVASAQNPAYTASSANLCPDINALVDPILSPEPPGRVSPSRDQTFHLTTTTGQPLEQGKTFECQLSDLTGNTTGGPLHPWRTCVDPVTYTGLPDGTYVFKVRVSGSNFPDSRTLTIDATPPATTLTSTLDSANGAPTAAQNVTFGVTAQDASNVTFTCFLQLTNPTPGGPALTATSLSSYSLGSPPLTVCTDSSCSGSPCNSPITLWGLSYGDWVFKVSARDAVGNVEQPGPFKAWKIRYTAGATYTRLDQAPVTPRKDAQVTVNLFAFTGSSIGDASLLPATSTFEYRLFNASSGGTGAWAPTGPALTVTLPSDGEWTVQARVTGVANPPADTVAAVTIVLDTTPPVIVITEQPTAMVGLKDGGQFLATVKFTTTKNESVTYQCRWLTSATAKVPEDSPEGTGLKAFSEANCNGIRPGTASQPVASGFWLFQVRANDTVGNLGAPTSVSFLVDTQPPVITNLQYPAYSQDRGVNITYDVADLGLSGLNAANITCSMTPTYLFPPPFSPRLGPRPPAMYLNVSGLPETPCRNPAMYALMEGKYQFTLTAADNAGLTTTVSALIVLDLQPPITKITNAPARGAFPKNFVVQFAAVDQPVGGASGVNRTICTLLWKSASITGTLSPPPPAPPQPPPASSAPAPPPGNRTLNGRRLTADDPGPAPTTPLAKVNGADILHNTPFTCTSPVYFMGLATATYELQAYSVDNAGNDGRPSLVASYSFLIDASLADDGSNTTSPDPGSSGGGGFASNTMAIALTIALSVAAAIAIIVGVCVARSRAARRRELRYQQDQQRLQQQQPPAGGYNNMWYGYPQPAARGVPAAQHGQSFQPVVQSADARRQWEEDKVRLAIQASVEEENMRKAIELSRQDQYSKMEEQRIQAAIKASLEASRANKR